jgi:hypothetical protein
VSVKRIGLAEAWTLPGTTEMHRSFDVTRFAGLTMTENDNGVKLVVGLDSSFVPWGNIIGVDYLPKPANDNAQAKK